MQSLEIYVNDEENKYVELGVNEKGIFYIRHSPESNWYELPAGEAKIGDGFDRERNAWHRFDRACEFRNQSYLDENQLTNNRFLLLYNIIPNIFLIRPCACLGGI